MKKTTLCVLLAITHTGFCSDMERRAYTHEPMVEGNRRIDEIMEWNKIHPGVMPPLTEQEKYELFTKDGLPVPGSGATVADGNGAYSMTQAQSAMVKNFNAQQKSKGYYEDYNKNAHLLLEMPEVAEREYTERKFMTKNPEDTHLYEVKSSMAMSYPYKGIPVQLAAKVIGFAPESIFINNGWAGAVEFFVPSFGGVCAFHEVNIELTQSATYINQDIATHLVNNKITTMHAMGSTSSGFTYEVEWWDKTFKRNLECASKQFSQPALDATIELAKAIDKG